MKFRKYISRTLVSSVIVLMLLILSSTEGITSQSLETIIRHNEEATPTTFFQNPFGLIYTLYEDTTILTDRHSNKQTEFVNNVYTISGRISDLADLPLEGITVEAAFTPETIFVQDEDRYPLGSAQVFIQAKLASICDSVSEIPLSECEALESFYTATDGDNWDSNANWLITNTPCDWYGVDCRNGYVDMILLSSNNLSGDLPAEVGDFSRLRWLDLSRNNITSVPSDIGKLSWLTDLSLTENAITQLPSEFGNLTSLDNLYLNDNQISSLPTAFFNLPNMETFQIANNQLSYLPPELGNLTSLNSLTLSFNQLSILPVEIGSLVNLYTLSISNNQLITVPNEIGNLSLLDSLYASNNQINTLPAGIGNLTALTNLILDHNLLTSLPPEIGDMAALDTLLIYNNNLSNLPSEFGQLTNLNSLNVNYNNLSDSIPEFMTGLVNLSTFVFKYTTWCVPPSGPVYDWVDQITTVIGTGLVCEDWEPMKFSVSGKISDESGIGISGVTVSAGTTGSTVTGITGEYTFTEFITGTYTITPTLQGRIFDPPTRTVTIPPDATGLNFIALGTRRSWAFIFYLDGDNEDLDTSYEEIFNRLEVGANNPDVFVLALWDGSDNDDSAYYEVQYDTDLGSLATYTDTVNVWLKGELDMGSAATVISFTNWARANYPADHYALILSDHGSGLGGGMHDETSGTQLTVADIGLVLSSVTQEGLDKIDVLYMDACLMGMIEDAYQVRDYVDYYVASEDLQWIYTIAYTSYVSNTTSYTTPQELAELFAMGYADEMAGGLSNYTISASDMSKLGVLTTAVDDLARLLRNGPYTEILKDAAVSVQRYDNNGDWKYNTDDEYIDLYHFAQLVQLNTDDTTLQAVTQAVMNAVEDYIIAEDHQREAGSNVDNSHGVSIFFPREGFTRSFYKEPNIDFAEGTHWGTQSLQTQESNEDGIAWGPMLVDYIEAVFPDAADDPNPPKLMSRLQINWVYLPLVMRH